MLFTGPLSNFFSLHVFNVGALEVGKTSYLPPTPVLMAVTIAIMLSLAEEWGYSCLLSWCCGHHGEWGWCWPPPWYFRPGQRTLPRGCPLQRWRQCRDSLHLWRGWPCHPPQGGGRHAEAAAVEGGGAHSHSLLGKSPFSLSFFAPCHFDKSIGRATVFWILSVGHFWFSEWIHQTASSIWVTAGACCLIWKRIFLLKFHGTSDKNPWNIREKRKIRSELVKFPNSQVRRRLEYADSGRGHKV